MTVKLGYTIFYVSDVGAALGFYSSVFGFAQRLTTPEGDYGELDTGETTLAFVSNELAAANLDAAGGFTALDATAAPAGASITLVTPDVAALFDAAVAAGARPYVEPVEKPWGQTVSYVIDPWGILLELATPMSG